MPEGQSPTVNVEPSIEKPIHRPRNGHSAYQIIPRRTGRTSCSLKAKRIISKQQQRCIVVLKRTGTEVDPKYIRGRRNRRPCQTDSCHICGPFLAMVVDGLERNNPGLIDDRHQTRPKHRPERQKAPLDCYQESCKVNGYDAAEQQIKRAKHCMVCREDGSEWHPRTLRAIEEYIQSNGSGKLAQTTRRIVAHRAATSKIASFFQAAITNFDRVSESDDAVRSARP